MCRRGIFNVQSQGRISAVLGPTNTGKTYVAIERMLTHTSGMMGFPLRLLARENYDKVAAIKGKAQVALITGEEQIIPENPRYFICTVEAMPLEKMVEFVCVDEIQLAADPDRGHIFTDRILHARGLTETMFIGSDTIQHLLQRMIPSIQIDSRQRFSELSYAGYKKIVRLPQRSAVVAFSAADVYALAEFMRRQRGGTAVVMGALSPRARNAQVGMYQAGEVDYIVATDAIGMGLNMDIDHVAFSTVRKFDGRNVRQLRASEIGQIAGRAGRYMRNGTFGTTADEGSLPDHLVKKIESHRFDPVQIVYWRNSKLDFSSIKELQYTLNMPAPREFYKRPVGLEDHEILGIMANDSGVSHLAQGYEAVKLLWEVCQVPDYRKLLTEIHARFLMQIYQHLMTGNGKIPPAFVEQQVAKLDQYDGDMNAIMTRLAHIRMWTYISNRSEWILNQSEWQERTRSIEDRLSDALHMELTQRFVDKRIAVLMKKLDENAEFTADVTGGGDVLVEGQFVGRLSGFRFQPDQEVLQTVSKPIKAAARKAVLAHLPKQVQKLTDEAVPVLALARNNEILWHGRPIAKLQAGKDILHPAVHILTDDDLDPQLRAKILEKIDPWLIDYLRGQLQDLYGVKDLKLSGAARGIAYQITENLGVLPLARIQEIMNSTGDADREILRDNGFQIGRGFLYARNHYAPRQTILRAQLWSLFHGRGHSASNLAGKIFVHLDDKLAPDDALAAGFVKIHQMYLRVDHYEKLAAMFESHFESRRPLKTREAKSILSVNAHQLAQLADAQGFVARKIDHGIILESRKKSDAKKKSKQTKTEINSPFAVLKN